MNPPMMIVDPSVRPVIKLVTICVTCVPVETAATLVAWQKRPTTNKSTAPYNDWSMFARRNGIAKRNSVEAIGPSDKSKAFIHKGETHSFRMVKNREPL